MRAWARKSAAHLCHFSAPVTLTHRNDLNDRLAEHGHQRARQDEPIVLSVVPALEVGAVTMSIGGGQTLAVVVRRCDG